MAKSAQPISGLVDPKLTFQTSGHAMPVLGRMNGDETSQLASQFIPQPNVSGDTRHAKRSVDRHAWTISLFRGDGMP